MEIKVGDYLYKERAGEDKLIYHIISIYGDNIKGKIIWKNDKCDWRLGQTLYNIDSESCGFFTTVRKMTEAEALAYTL